MNKQEIFDIIAGHTREVVPGLDDHRFRFDESLRNLGANSIDRSEILMMTLDSLALTIPLVELAGAQDMGELADLLCRKGPQRA